MKIGIRADFCAARLWEQDVSAFMAWYTRTPDYLRAQAQPGAMRVDLAGLPFGPVSPENAAYAAARLDAIRYAKFRKALVGDAVIGTEQIVNGDHM